MREPDRDPGRIADIMDAANNLAEFTNGITYEAFLGDKLRFFAILKNIEIIGEAAYMTCSLPVLRRRDRKSHGRALST